MNPLIDIRYFRPCIPVVRPFTDTVLVVVVVRLGDDELEDIDRVTAVSVVALRAGLCLQGIGEETDPSLQIVIEDHVRMVLTDERIACIVLNRPTIERVGFGVVTHGVYHRVAIGLVQHQVQLEDRVTALERRVFGVLLTRTISRLVVDDRYRIFGHNSAVRIG